MLLPRLRTHEPAIYSHPRWPPSARQLATGRVTQALCGRPRQQLIIHLIDSLEELLDPFRGGAAVRARVTSRKGCGCPLNWVMSLFFRRIDISISASTLRLHPFQFILKTVCLVWKLDFKLKSVTSMSKVKSEQKSGSSEVEPYQSSSDAGSLSSRSARTLADLNVPQYRFLFFLLDRKRNVVAPDALISSSHSIHDPPSTAFLLHHRPFSLLFLTLSFHFDILSSFLTTTGTNGCHSIVPFF